MKFKCKATNLIYNFEFDVDILSMQKHPDYEEVPSNESVPDNEEVPDNKEEIQEETKPVKTPKKAKVTPDESSING